MLAHLPSGSCFTASSKLQNSVFRPGYGPSCNASPFFLSSHCPFSCGNWYAALLSDQYVLWRKQHMQLNLIALILFRGCLSACPFKRREYAWTSVSAPTSGLVIFLRLLVCISQLPPSGRTPLPSVGMLRHTDHQRDHYCTECYYHPRADSDNLPPVSLIGELTLAVFHWCALMITGRHPATKTSFTPGCRGSK